MPEFHRLDPRADAPFLADAPADPLTGVPFRPANEVVRCATCGVVALRETWEALDGCPNGHATPAPWPTASAGDGAATAVPVKPTAAPAAAAAPARNRWLTPLLVAVGVAGLLLLVVLAAGLLSDDDDDPTPVVTDEAPAGPTGPTPVAVAGPGLIEGALTATDFEGEDRRYQDLYTFAADSSGQVLAFRASSEAFLPRLVVETPSGDRFTAEFADEDPDTGRRTVAVSERLREPGLYRVRVSSEQPAETGAYELRIASEVPVRPIRAGADPLQATLGEFSERVEGVFRDRYRFTAEADREYTVTVNSGAFAPTVAVEGPGGAARGETGRSGGTVTFVFTPARDGAHTIVVGSREAGARGAYRVGLAVEDVAAEPVVRLLPTDGSAVSDTLAVGGTATFALAGRVGDRVRVEVRAGGFAPALRLLGPDGSQTAMAAPDGDRARLRDVVLPTRGTYRLLVSAPDGGGGPFTVAVEEAAVVAPEDIPRTPGQF